jgi:hypothetical protein
VIGLMALVTLSQIPPAGWQVKFGDQIPGVLRKGWTAVQHWDSSY